MKQYSETFSSASTMDGKIWLAPSLSSRSKNGGVWTGIVGEFEGCLEMRRLRTSLAGKVFLDRYMRDSVVGTWLSRR
jgi:hypothetical protein